MRFKWQRKNWLLTAFIIGIILLFVWIIVLFTDTAEKNTFSKIWQWVMLVWFIFQPIPFYLAYKNELKKDNVLQMNKSDVQ